MNNFVNQEAIKLKYSPWYGIISVVQERNVKCVGKYVNPGNSAFAIIAGDETYVDKSGLIEFTNSRIGKMRPLICFSRPRRFGKSIAAHMLTAYYSRGCDSIKNYGGDILLVGINYDEKEKKHTCDIEKFEYSDN